MLNRRTFYPNGSGNMIEAVVSGANQDGYNRRDFIKGAATATVGIVIVESLNCGGKSVSGTVTLITGAISELKLLYPSLPILDKVVRLATDFNKDWTDGKFDSARTFFENLDSTVQQVITDLGINASPRAKLLLASVGIAVRVIASLINEQGQQAGVMAEANATAPKTVSRIKQLSNAADSDWILRAVMH